MESVKKEASILFFLFCFTYAVRAHIAHFDEVWQQRAKEAEQRTDANYDPNPTAVTNQLNANVDKALKTANTNARRLLQNENGACEATNPIDTCWRCKSDWAKNRQHYAKCVLGFGRKTTGGLGGNEYIVTDSSDNDMVNPKNGTLRHAVIQKEPLWIIFAKDMAIRLRQELMVTSNKTIDGRGAKVQIQGGAGFMLQFVDNVIITNIHIKGTVPASGGLIRDSVDHYGKRTKSDGDAISIFGSTNIWIDHMSLIKCADGLIDAVQGSTAITVSNNYFADHNDVMLFGASNAYKADQKMQATVAFNHFGEGCIQRMPRCRWGFFHVVNNDYTHWLMYAIGGSQNPTIISQGNRFAASNNAAAKEVTKREAPESEWKNWVWKSENDLMVDGAFFVESGGPLKTSIAKDDMITAKPGSAVESLTRSSGALNCRVGSPC